MAPVKSDAGVTFLQVVCSTVRGRNGRQAGALTLGPPAPGKPRKLFMFPQSDCGPTPRIAALATAGVDVVAKEEILSLVTDMVRRGRAAVMVSSEIQELVDHCDRIYVIRDGSIFEVVSRGEVSTSELAAMCAHHEVGVSSNPR